MDVSTPLRWAAAALVMLLTTAAHAADKPPTPGVVVTLDEKSLPRTTGYVLLHADVQVDGKPLAMDCGLWLPKAYKPGGPPLPTIVHLHNRFAIGNGGDGDSLIGEGLPNVLCRGATADPRATGRDAAVTVNPHDDVAVICVVPHCPADHGWELDPMPRVIEAVTSAIVKAYGADEDRVYLTGFSYGASGTWSVAEQTPARWAAVAPMDGRRTDDPVRTVARLRHVGVFLVEGEVDGDFTNDGRMMRDALAAAGHPDFAYRELAGGNHFTYVHVCTDPAFWGWLLAHRRRPLTAGDLAALPPMVKAVANKAASLLRPVTVALREAELPHGPGYRVATADVRLDGKVQPLPFGLYLPADYGLSASTAYPVVVSLHDKDVVGGNGRGELASAGLPLLLSSKAGRDPRQTGRGTVEHYDPRVDLSAIVIAPQCPANHTWDDPTMVAYVEQLTLAVTEAYKADADRAYLTGWSYGGSAAWLVAAKLPDRFAAIASIDGRVPNDVTAVVDRLRNVGIFQAVGANDREFLPDAQRMVVALAAAQHPNFTFRGVPDGNHYSYAVVYTDPTFWSWLLSQHRDPAATARMVALDAARLAAEKAAAEKAEKAETDKAAAAKVAADKAAADKAAAAKRAAEAARRVATRAARPTSRPANRPSTRHSNGVP